MPTLPHAPIDDPDAALARSSEPLGPRVAEATQAPLPVVLEQLLSRALLDSVDERGRTPMIRAIDNRQHELVRFLSTRVDPFFLTKKHDHARETALMHAAGADGDLESVKILLETAADPFALAQFSFLDQLPAIFDAARGSAPDSVERVRALLPFSDPDNFFGDNAASQELTPLMFAASTGTLETVEFLLGATDANAFVWRNGGPLRSAARRANDDPEKLPVLRRLLAEPGLCVLTSPDEFDGHQFHNCAPLAQAIQRHDLEAVRLLLPRCPQDALTQRGGSSVITLALSAPPEMMELLAPLCDKAFIFANPNSSNQGGHALSLFQQALRIPETADVLGAALIERGLFSEMDRKSLADFQSDQAYRLRGRAPSAAKAFPRIRAADEARALREALLEQRQGLAQSAPASPGGEMPASKGPRDDAGSSPRRI